jgi:hypothetical protein
MRARSPCHPVIGDEPRLACSRVLLSSVLAGETALEDIELKLMSCGAIGAIGARDRALAVRPRSDRDDKTTISDDRTEPWASRALAPSWQNAAGCAGGWIHAAITTGSVRHRGASAPRRVGGAGCPHACRHWAEPRGHRARRAMRETTRAAQQPRLSIDRPGEQYEQVFPWSGCCP